MLTKNYPKTVALRDGREIVIRLLREDDLDKLHRFFEELPEEDRVFLRHDVTDRDLLRRWTEQIDLDSITPLVAVDGDAIVGDATLHFEKSGWMQHIGAIRIVTAATHRANGLGTCLTRELVRVAQIRDIEKLRALTLEDDEGSIRMLRGAGFELAAVLKEMGKDRKGKKCNISVMVNDVEDLRRILEDWYQDSTIPEFRAPGGGVA